MELKFPSQNSIDYTWFEYKLEKETNNYPGSEGSFCRTFMEAVESFLDDYAGKLRLSAPTTVRETINLTMEAGDLIFGIERGKGGPQYDHMKQRCEKVNRDYKELRERVNETMMEFLYENDGVIDRWPYFEDVWRIDIETENEGAEKIEFPFAYFGGEYKPQGYKVYRAPEGPTFSQNYYSPYITPELEEAKEADKLAHENYFGKLKNAGSKGLKKKIFAFFPFLLALCFIAFGAYCLSKGQVPAAVVKQWLESLSSVPAILLLIPKIILYPIAYVLEILLFSKTLFFAASLGLIVLTLAKAAKKIKAVNKGSVNKETLERLKQENFEASDKRFALEKEIRNISESWNRAYFNHIVKLHK